MPAARRPGRRPHRGGKGGRADTLSILFANVPSWSEKAAHHCLHAGDTIGEELFRQAARFKTKRVYYQPSLYTNPYLKDESSVSAIKESFERHRATYVRLLKKRILEERDEQSQEEATKPKAKARRAAKSRATPKRATRVAPPNMASVPS